MNKIRKLAFTIGIVITLIGIGYYWWTGRPQVVQGIATIISAGIAGFCAFLIYQLQSLRLHSERLLEKEISPWLKDIVTRIFVLNPLNLDEDEKWIEEFDFEKLPALFEEHLKTGYKQIYLRYKDWRGRVKEHNEKLKKFVRELRDKAKSEIGLSSNSDFPNRGKIYCYYQRMISNLLTLVIANSVNGELNHLKTQLKIEVHERKYSVRLYAGELVEGIFYGDPESAKILEIEKFIKEVSHSQKVIEETKNFYANYNNLIKDFENLRDEIIKIENELKAGGLIKGKCRVCP